MKSQGRHGEVAAELHTDVPERFAERRRVFALMPDGRRRELRVERFWPHKGRIVLKFAGVDSIGAAEELAGAEIQVRDWERAPLEPGAAYVSELIGCSVVVHTGAERRNLGKIADVQFGAGEAPLLIVRSPGPAPKEYMIPYAEPYLNAVDTARRHVEMTLPEGMLDLDAPLSREEKEHQQRG